MDNRRGFTLLEMVIALLFGAVLASVAVTGLGGVQGRLAVRSAQSSFLSSHAWARALAVERGMPVQLVVDPADRTVTIREGCDGSGDEISSRDFGEAYQVTITTAGGPVSLCFGPRGVALPNLNSFAGQSRIDFVRADRASAVVLRPLGQALVP